MRPMVTRLAAIANPTAEQAIILGELGEDRAEPGMYYIIDDATQAIIWHAFLFLRANYGSTGRVTADNPMPSFATNKKDAYNLREWLAFIDAIKCDWRKAGHDTLFAYAGYQISRVSQLSGKMRDPNTVGIKLGTVKAFYTYTNAIRLTTVTWDAKAIAARFRTNRRRRAKEDEKIRPFGKDDVPLIREQLGKLPSELPKDSLRSTRDRLLFETGVRTGMRGEEICYLRASAFKRLTPDPERPNATQPMRIQITKGRVHRTVAIPNRLIGELKAYIVGERARSVKKLLDRGVADHGYLFVNLEDASRPGSQLTTNTIQRDFTALMIRLKMFEEAVRTKKGAAVKVKVPNHSFHDTRHTFAVRYYVGLKRVVAKNPAALNYAEPWELVQIALGHADWETTRKHYLRHVDDYEAAIGERVNEWMEEA
ncbi:tyrosine-type recombinase/integrase [Sphingomonas sp. UYP23]